MSHRTYTWPRAPDDVKACVLAFIEKCGYRIAALPAPILLVHPLNVTVDEILGRPITRCLEDAFDSPMFVPFEDKMIAVWCRSLELELKDA
jgi:hypothetical protein